jgi:hypothetical protein
MDSLTGSEDRVKRKAKKLKQGAHTEPDTYDGTSNGLEEPKKKGRKRKDKDDVLTEHVDDNAERERDSKPVEQVISTKRKKRRETEEKLLTAHESGQKSVEDEDTRKDDRRKRKHREPEPVVTPSHESETLVEATEEKKKRKSKKRVDEDGVHPTEEKSSKKRSRKRSKGEGIPIVKDAREDDSKADTLVPKKKKRKSEDDAAIDETASKKKRSKRHKTDLTDPSHDKSLSGGSSKGECLELHVTYLRTPQLNVVLALYYAYLHVAEPKSWKFNKAKQNWIIRNIWSETEVSGSIHQQERR